VSRLRAEVEIAVVEVGEATSDIEAEARSPADRLRGEERSEDASAVLLRNSGPSSMTLTPTESPRLVAVTVTFPDTGAAAIALSMSFSHT